MHLLRYHSSRYTGRLSTKEMCIWQGVLRWQLMFLRVHCSLDHLSFHATFVRCALALYIMPLRSKSLYVFTGSDDDGGGSQVGKSAAAGREPIIETRLLITSCKLNTSSVTHLHLSTIPPPDPILNTRYASSSQLFTSSTRPAAIDCILALTPTNSSGRVQPCLDHSWYSQRLWETTQCDPHSLKRLLMPSLRHIQVKFGDLPASIDRPTL